MPSPIKIHKRQGDFYKRKGGAWIRLKNGYFKHVGTGRGDYSKRNVISDRHRTATAIKDKKKVARYPQAYDLPYERRQAINWKKRSAKKTKTAKKTKKTRKKKSSRKRKKR